MKRGGVWKWELTCSFRSITKCLEDFGGGKHHGFENLILSPFLFLLTRAISLTSDHLLITILIGFAETNVDSISEERNCL